MSEAGIAAVKDHGHPANTADPVTVAVTFSVRPGHYAEFESWAREITIAAGNRPGHLGGTWMRSGSAYHVVYRFADHARFNDWHESTERATFLERLHPIAAIVMDEHGTGLETWFELPEQPGRPSPPRWKMAVATWVGVFPLLGLLQWLIGPRLVSLPLMARVMLLTLIMVGLMTYVVMPRLARLFRSWLYPA